jgi:hypothetical protein
MTNAFLGLLDKSSCAAVIIADTVCMVLLQSEWHAIVDNHKTLDDCTDDNDRGDNEDWRYDHDALTLVLRLGCS